MSNAILTAIMGALRDVTSPLHLRIRTLEEQQRGAAAVEQRLAALELRCLEIEGHLTRPPEKRR